MAGHHADLGLTGVYEGAMVDGRYHGHGTLKYPGGTYTGDFRNGELHGEGVLVLKEGKFEGSWERGKLCKGSFVFPDGLQHRPVDMKHWPYCSPEDPRFHCEIKEGLALGEPLRYETQAGAHTLRLPAGCYDTVDGYYDPKRLSVCSLETLEPIRMPSADEKVFILGSCRQQK